MDRTWDQLRALRIEHDSINGKPLGTLSRYEQERLSALRQQLSGTEFMPWSETQTKESYESVYGQGTWKD